MSKELSVILPSYLEEENLNLLLPRIKEHCAKSTDSFEILVVDTQTPLDGTAKVCANHNVIYINRENGNAYGDAIRTGIKHAHGSKIIFMDADGSHPPHFIEKLYQVRNEADICIASRYVEGGHTENSKILILMSLIVNIGYRLILNLKCKDVSNSFKLYPGKELKALVLKCNNFDVVEEILYKIIKSNPHFKIKEIPFTFKKRMFGETKRNLIKFIFTYLITLVKLRFGS